jgi:hypothetical protein
MVYRPQVEVLAEKLKTCLSYAQSADEWLPDGINPRSSLMKDAQ